MAKPKVRGAKKLKVKNFDPNLAQPVGRAKMPDMQAKGSVDSSGVSMGFGHSHPAGPGLLSAAMKTVKTPKRA